MRFHNLVLTADVNGKVQEANVRFPPCMGTGARMMKNKGNKRQRTNPNPDDIRDAFHWPKFSVQTAEMQMYARIKRKFSGKKQNKNGRPLEVFRFQNDITVPFAQNFPFPFSCLIAPSRTIFDQPMRLQVWNGRPKPLKSSIVTRP